jgi:hypothetical protein
VPFPDSPSAPLFAALTLLATTACSARTSQSETPDAASTPIEAAIPAVSYCAGASMPKRILGVHGTGAIDVRGETLVATFFDGLTGEGLIQILNLATGALATVPGRQYPGAPSVGAKDVYWIDHEGLMRAPLDGSSAPVKMADAVGGLVTLVVDETVYFGTVSAILSVPAAGGAPVTLLDPGAGPEKLASDGEYIYWTACGGSQKYVVGRISRKGGAPQQLVAEAYCPIGMALDGTDVYWADGETKDAQGMYQNQASLHRVPASGGMDTVFVGSGLPLGIAQNLAVDDRSVYGCSDILYRVSKTGGAPESIGGQLRGVLDVAVDASCVYWVDATGVHMMMK